jgi:hypothetical protein
VPPIAPAPTSLPKSKAATPIDATPSKAAPTKPAPTGKKSFGKESGFDFK